MELATALNPRRVAFFGGSFDPPHLGHLAVARAARTALKLDTVLFAPVGAQPLKPLGSTASFADRLAMTGLAIEGEEGFEVALADAPKESGSPNYTLETLQLLKSGLPAGGTLFCLMGADSFFGLQRWHRAAEIPFVASLIVASRPGERPDEWADGLRAALPEGFRIDADVHREDAQLHRYTLRNQAEETAPLYLLPGLHVDISASQIRELIREHEESPGSSAEAALVPRAVLDYIHAHRLYC